MILVTVSLTRDHRSVASSLSAMLRKLSQELVNKTQTGSQGASSTRGAEEPLLAFYGGLLGAQHPPPIASGPLGGGALMPSAQSKSIPLSTSPGASAAEQIAYVYLYFGGKGRRGSSVLFWLQRSALTALSSISAHVAPALRPANKPANSGDAQRLLDAQGLRITAQNVHASAARQLMTNPRFVPHPALQYQVDRFLPEDERRQMFAQQARERLGKSMLAILPPSQAANTSSTGAGSSASNSGDAVAGDVVAGGAVITQLKPLLVLATRDDVDAATATRVVGGTLADLAREVTALTQEVQLLRCKQARGARAHYSFFVNHPATNNRSAANNRSAIMRAKQALEEERSRHAGLAMSDCWVKVMPASVREGINFAKEGLDAWMKRTIECTKLLRPPTVKSPLV